MSESDSVSARLLTGVRVVDLAGGIAGAYATQLLGDAGATVTRARSLPLEVRDAGTRSSERARAALVQLLNRGKEFVDHVDTAVAAADIVIGDGAWAGFAPDRARERRPALTVVTISDCGLTGPWSDRPMTSAIRQALAGSIFWRGDKSLPPLMVGGEIEEFLAGAYAASGALAAMRRCRADGVGDHLDLSLLEVTNIGLTTFGTTLASTWNRLDEDYPARSIQIPAIEKTRDGWVGLCTISARQWQDLMLIAGRPDLADDESLAYADVREARSHELREAITSWTTQRTTAEVIELCSALRIPVAPVGNGSILPGNEQLNTRNFFTDDASGATTPGRVFRFHSDPAGGSDGVVRMRRQTSGTDLPLVGLRVLDLTAWWSGPSATHLFAALGADVVKVEAISHPDGMRYSFVADPSVEQWWELGPVFLALNTNKRGITLDLTTRRGCEVLEDLAKQADVLMENFTPRVLENYDIDWARVRRDNPALMVTRMSAFGLDGPWRERTGFAQTIEQTSGLAWMTGHPEAGPTSPRGVCDPLAGIHAAFATLASLTHRDTGGSGGTVEVSMLEPAVYATIGQVFHAQLEDAAPGRAGNRDAVHCPQDVYPTAGGEEWLAISVRTAADWRALARILDRPEWTTAAWEALASRRDRQGVIDEAITDWLATRKAADAADELVAAGVPAARVDGSGRLLMNPQLQHRCYFEQVDHPIAGPHPLPGLPFRSATGPRVWNRTPAPTLGQHTREVLQEWLTMSPSAIETLFASGVSGTSPNNL
jgi:crotonobetainyl-CoA:carnitine CoA-transferase CaiB-like acyl-CoA transferase